MGKTFAEATLLVVLEQNSTDDRNKNNDADDGEEHIGSGGPLLLAAQVDGGISICPTSVVIREDTVLFALARDSGECDAIARGGSAAGGGAFKSGRASFSLPVAVIDQ